MSTSSEWVAGWLASEETSHDVISVKRVYIDINDGNLHDGILFSQIMYWHGRSKETGKPRLSVEKNGEMWLAKSYDAWFDECRILSATARKCIDRIAKRKLIIKKLFKFNGAPMVHVRIDWDVLENRIKSICDVVSNPNATEYQKETIPDSKSLTETTSETTSKKESTRKRSTTRTPDTIHPLIQAWVTVRGIDAVNIGAPVFSSKDVTLAKRMMKWDAPPTSKEIEDAVKASKAKYYPFMWLEVDIPKYRLANKQKPATVDASGKTYGEMAIERGRAMFSERKEQAEAV